jgi:hypothetical protein
MYKFLLFTLLFLSSCKSPERREDDDAPVQAPTTKVDASQFSVSLEVEDYVKGNISGVLFKPTLDPKATYLIYDACTVEKNKCTSGMLIGLSEDVIYDIPVGELNISYQACVQASRAISQPCSEKKTIRFTHKVKNSAPLHLAP